eukprot:5448067-Amphidinium_carterae.4
MSDEDTESGNDNFYVREMPDAVLVDSDNMLVSEVLHDVEQVQGSLLRRRATMVYPPREVARERFASNTCQCCHARAAKGIGGTSRSLGRFNVPMGLGGMCGVVTVTIVDEPEIPLSHPVGLMQGLGSVLSLPKLLSRWTQCKAVAKSDIYQMGSGHLDREALQPSLS